MGRYRRVVLLLVLFFINFWPMAQNPSAASKTSGAGVMVSEGKIYVVMAVVLTILVGLILYVLRVDKKITRLEKQEH